MAFYSIPLKAGVPHVQDVAGVLILVDGIDGAAGVDVTPIINGSLQTTMPARKAGFKYRTGFDAVQLSAGTDCTVRIFLTTNDVSLGFTDGAQVNVAGGVSILNAADNRVPVDLAGGTVQVTAGQVDLKPLTTLVDKPAANVMQVAAQVMADATLRRIAFRNASASAQVALGGAGVSLDSPITLGPGDIYFADDAAGATWYAIADQDNVKLSMMGMK
jgi:hypothetical protein